MIRCIVLVTLFILSFVSSSYSSANHVEENTSDMASQQSFFEQFLAMVDPYFNYRNRFQWDNRTGNSKRRRGRHRIKAGARMKPHQDVVLTAGIASGGENPRTTNHTYARKWEKPEIRVDLLNLKLTPLKWLKLIGGKFEPKEAFWNPSTMLWDSSIIPLGVSATVSYDIFERLKIWLNGGYLAVKELQHKKKPPQLLFVQGGEDFKDGDFLSKLALTFYRVTNSKETAFKFSSKTNTKVSPSMRNKYRFNVLNPALEAGLKDLAQGYVRYGGVFIESVHNLDPKSKNNGFGTGFTVGSKSTPKKQGEWRGKYDFRYLEKNAFMDTFPDSSFQSGGTNAKGHRVGIQYSPIDHFVLAVTYFNTRQVSGKKNREQVLEVDGSIVF